MELSAPVLCRRGQVETVAGAEDVRESLHILLHTALRERPMASSYGCDVAQFLFEEIDQHLVTGVRQAISTAILHHEPRIVLDAVQVQPSATTAGLLLIDIAYTLRATNSRYNFVYPFYITEASGSLARAPRIQAAMEDFVIVQGDQVVFQPAFGAAVVVVQPGVMQGTGKMALSGRKVCLQGDEGKLSVPGCPYTAGAFSIPGVGTLQIAALAGNQLSQKTQVGGKPVILKGATFVAKFVVQAPAQQPTPGGPVPDPLPQYAGSGSFMTTNAKLKAG